MAAVSNLQIDQGSEFDTVFTFWQDTAHTLPVNLTGYTARLSIASAYGAAPVFTLTVGSGLTMGGVSGTISVSITGTQTGQLAAGTYVWDLLVIDTLGALHRFLQGTVFVSARVTT